MTARRRTRARRPPRNLRVEWTERALTDLRELGEFIARDDAIAAERWVQSLLQLAERAAELPFAGRQVPEFEREELREVLLKTYRLVYRIAKDRIQVLTVFEGHRKLPRK